MRIRLLLAAAATLTLAACGESSTAPTRFSPSEDASRDELTCRSGYHIATRDDGTQYCESDNTINGSGRAAPPPAKP
jgi:ABC-type uncharacterized transport system auxiliary subunit